MTESIWCLNHFYNPDELTALYDQIPLRASCRRFLAAPSAEQWNGLCAAAGRLSLPGVRLMPDLCSTDLFQPMLGLLMKFENVHRYVAIYAPDSAEGMINAGISGEMLMLEACRLGMAGVWVSGTFKRQAVPAAKPGERLAAVLALGIPPADFSALQRKRKPLQTLTENSLDESGLFRDVATAVRAAPSALNGQPWRLGLEADGTITLSVKKSSNLLDLGIAAAHALLALGNTPARLDHDQLSVRMKPVS